MIKTKYPIKNGNFLTNKFLICEWVVKFPIKNPLFLIDLFLLSRKEFMYRD